MNIRPTWIKRQSEQNVHHIYIHLDTHSILQHFSVSWRKRINLKTYFGLASPVLQPYWPPSPMKYTVSSDFNVVSPLCCGSAIAGLLAAEDPLQTVTDGQDRQ